LRLPARVVAPAEIGAIDEEAEARRDVLLPATTLAGLATPSIVPGVGAGDDGNEAVSRILRCINNDSKSSYGNKNSSRKNGCRAKFSVGEGDRKGTGVIKLVEAAAVVALVLVAALHLGRW
jgi:hypothetical protein